jgi:hypothetical protein
VSQNVAKAMGISGKMDGSPVQEYFLDHETIMDELERNEEEIESTFILDLAQKKYLKSRFKMEKKTVGSIDAYVIKFEAPELNESFDEMGRPKDTDHGMNLDVGAGPKMVAQGNPLAQLSGDAEKKGGEKQASNAESSTGTKKISGSGGSESDEDAYSSDEDYLSDEDAEEDDEDEEEESGEGPSSSSNKLEEVAGKQVKEESKGTSNTPFKAKESEDLLEITEVKGEDNKEERSGSNSESESAELSEDEKLDDEEGNEGHDGVSSSKSMTSSATSFAQFSKSIKALVNYETGKLKKYVSWFKITLIMTIVILIVTSIVSFDIISDSISKHDEYSSFVNEVGDMRFYTQSLSYYSRILSLMDNG